MKNKKSFLKGALCGALAMLIVFVAGVTVILKVIPGGLTGAVSPAVEKKINILRTYIDMYYLKDVDEKSMADGIYAGYINGLKDPYSVYFNEEETKEFQESTSGKYVGIGAVLTQEKDTGIIVMTHIFKDSPAMEAGLKDNDILYKVEDREVTGEDLSGVVSNIRGEEGTKVKLTVLRGEDQDEIEVSATRAKVETETVESKMLSDGIGYISISEFDEVTYDQYMEHLNELEKQNAKGLVVDLRSNPGGNLATVCGILDQMLPEGMIVYTEDKDGKKQEFTSDEENQYKKPMVVLVNGYSASASEIYAGAIQDYGLGKIIGTQTYGKGVVQKIFPLKDGTCVKLTVSEYFTPNGRNINEKGITPDVKVEYKADENNPEADNQLEKAVEELKKEL